jgi:hypothetical protein
MGWPAYCAGSAPLSAAAIAERALVTRGSLMGSAPDQFGRLSSRRVGSVVRLHLLVPDAGQPAARSGT